MKILSIITVFLFCALPIHSEVSIPGDGFAIGWEKSEPLRRFPENALFNHINGGAELFLEFGFKTLSVQYYKNSAEEITLEIYQMTCPEAGLGIYLTKCGNETPLKEISARNSGNQYQLTIVKGSYFILVNNFSGNKALLHNVITLAQLVLASLPEEEPVTLFEMLPKEGLIKESVLIVRGLYALQPIYTFGKGDVLQLGGKVFGVVGDYQTAQGQTFTHLVISYPAEEAAILAFENIAVNLDAYSKIVQKESERFVFQDFQNKFSEVRLEKNKLLIKIKLTEQPVDE